MNVKKGGAIPDYNAIHSLMSSISRSRVLFILVEEGPLYQSHIARKANLSVGDVIGAIRGNGSKYSKSGSLTVLGLVEEIELPDERMRVYMATPAGIKICNKFRQDADFPKRRFP